MFGKDNTCEKKCENNAFKVLICKFVSDITCGTKIRDFYPKIKPYFCQKKKGITIMKTKKLLCIILAALTLLSCFSSAFTAFAADDTVTQAKNLIDSFNGDMTVYNVKAEDLEAYHAMIQAYNALSAEEIETLDVFAFDKLLLAVYDREMALWKNENNSTSTSNAYKAVQARAEKVIKMPSYVSTAAELGEAASAISTQTAADSFIEKIKAAPVNAVILAGGYYKSYKAFRYSVAEKYGVELLDAAADKISSLTQKADSANKPSSPKSFSKPNVNNFDGENDSAYIEAYQKYLAYKEAQADYNIAKCEYEFSKHYLSALETLTQAVPYFSFVYDICKNAVDAKRNFNENGDTAKITEVMNIYNILTPAQKTWFE